jgi:hypothetical protein
VKEKEFTSHYIPWREVWMVGVTQEELDAEQSPTDGTEAIVDPDTGTVDPVEIITEITPEPEEDRPLF